MADWKSRLREKCTMISPSGQQFSAYWTGNEITMAKRLARFQYPGVDGETAQDNGRNSYDWPLTFHFEGPQNDIDSWAFFIGLDAVGIWTIIHPVYGRRRLQLVNAKLVADPTGSGNITQVDTSWMEPINQSTVSSYTDLANAIGAQVAAVNAGGLEQFASMVYGSNVSQVQALLSQARGAVGSIRKSITDLYSEAMNYYNQVLAASGTTQADVNGVAGGIVALAQSSGIVSGSLVSQLNGYTKIVSDILGQLPAQSGTFDQAAKNQVAVTEIASTSLLCAACNAVTTAEMTTRSETVAAISGITNLFNLITNALDAYQSASAQYSISLQYFSQSTTYADLLNLVALANSFVLRSAYDLKVEKRYTIDRDVGTFALAIKLYQPTNPTAAEQYYDFLCQTNDLHNRDLLLLHSGREVKIYV